MTIRQFHCEKNHALPFARNIDRLPFNVRQFGAVNGRPGKRHAVADDFCGKSAGDFEVLLAMPNDVPTYAGRTFTDLRDGLAFPNYCIYLGPA